MERAEDPPGLRGILPCIVLYLHQGRFRTTLEIAGALLVLYVHTQIAGPNPHNDQPSWPLALTSTRGFYSPFMSNNPSEELGSLLIAQHLVRFAGNTDAETRMPLIPETGLEMGQGPVHQG